MWCRPSLKRTERKHKESKEVFSQMELNKPLDVWKGEERILSVTRIVSLAPSNTEILAEIGASDSIVAVSEYCDYPEQIHKPKLPGWTDIQIKDVLSFSPDLICLSTICQNE